MVCQYCETGECPCGVGCDACAGTAVCSECHGRCWAETEDYSAKHADRMAARGFTWCGACRRRTRQLPAMPNYEDVRESRPQYYAKMVTLERCTGCHVAFNDCRNRPFGYKIRDRLRELSAA